MGLVPKDIWTSLVVKYLDIERQGGRSRMSLHGHTVKPERPSLSKVGHEEDDQSSCPQSCSTFGGRKHTADLTQLRVRDEVCGKDTKSKKTTDNAEKPVYQIFDQGHMITVPSLDLCNLHLQAFRSGRSDVLEAQWHPFQP